jgi:hypothetical protein
VLDEVAGTQAAASRIAAALAVTCLNVALGLLEERQPQDQGEDPEDSECYPFLPVNREQGQDENGEASK